MIGAESGRVLENISFEKGIHRKSAVSRLSMLQAKKYVCLNQRKSLSHGTAHFSVEMAERSKAAASGAVPLRRARVRTSLSISARGLDFFFLFVAQRIS